MADDNWELINSAFPGSSDISPFSFSDGQYIYAGFGEWYQDGYYGGYWYKDEDIFRYDINNSVWSFFDRWDQFYDRPQVSIHNENLQCADVQICTNYKYEELHVVKVIFKIRHFSMQITSLLQLDQIRTSISATNLPKLK